MGDLNKKNYNSFWTIKHSPPNLGEKNRGASYSLKNIVNKMEANKIPDAEFKQWF